MPAHKKEHRKSERQRSAEYRQRKVEQAERAAQELNRMTEEQFHAFMREKDRDKFDFAAAELLHEQVLDQVYFMQHGNKVNGIELDETDPDWVSTEEGEACLDDFVRNHGVVHFGYIYKSPLLYGAVWNTRYWTDKQIFDALCNEEGEATSIYARYGMLAGVPDGIYLRWKAEHGKTKPVDIGRVWEASGSQQTARYR